MLHPSTNTKHTDRPVRSAGMANVTQQGDDGSVLVR